MTQTTNTSAASKSNSEQYFNMTTTVVGHMNRMRVVPAKGKQPSYLALDFNALNGGPGYDNAETKFFALCIKGDQANKAIQSLIDTDKKGDKYFAKVEIADFGPASYEATRDGTNYKKGDTILIMKGRLIKVHFVTKNGERVFDLKKFTQETVNGENAQDDFNATELPANADNDGEFNQSNAGIHAEAGAQDDFNEPELPAKADNDGDFNESDAELHAEAHA